MCLPDICRGENLPVFPSPHLPAKTMFTALGRHSFFCKILLQPAQAVIPTPDNLICTFTYSFFSSFLLPLFSHVGEQQSAHITWLLTLKCEVATKSFPGRLANGQYHFGLSTPNATLLLGQHAEYRGIVAQHFPSITHLTNKYASHL